MAIRKKKSALAKKKDNPNSAYWKKKADRAWGAVVHASGGGCVCQLLGDCKGTLEAHHLITRSRDATRHDPRNGVLLCSYHHKWSRKCSPHMAPLEFAEFLQTRHPEIWKDFLDLKFDSVMSDETYQGRRMILEDIYKEITGKEMEMV